MSGLPPVRLAAILFTDMVGYSALCQRSEALASGLLEDHRRMVRAALPRFGGREVDTTGDGFLLEFGSALQATQCAIWLQQRQAARNAAAPEDRRFQFRVGIHLGDIETREKNIAGDGVNIAARVEPLSPHGGLALSGPVHAVVHNRIAAQFRSIGTPPLKNISAPIEVFVLDAAAVASVRLPDATTAAASAVRRWRVIGLAGAAIAGVAIAVLLLRPGERGNSRVLDKSVAVLPFENFSSEKDNEFFAAGIHDSLLTHLARVHDLKVISRTSVMQFKDGARNLRDIGRTLGVAAVVEGSVQRTGNRVRVQAQLIEAATDRHLWAETFDRELADVFAIQSEIAQQIVAGVQAVLTPAEKGRIEKRPTSNAEAYDLYLRAKQLSLPASPDRESLFMAEGLLQRAVEIDPAFALAHAELAVVHTELYWWGVDATNRRRDRARRHVDTAMRLGPDLAESHYALGIYHYHGFRDYERAQAAFDRALDLAPNAADLIASSGYVQRRRGLWPQALATFERAAALDPRNAGRWIDLGETSVTMRRYAQGIGHFERAVELAPGDPVLAMLSEVARFQFTGDLGPVKRMLDAVPEGVDPSQAISSARAFVAYLEGRYADAVSLMTAVPRDALSFGTTNLEVPKDFYLGQSWTQLGEKDKARRCFENAAARLRDYIAREPDSVMIPSARAWLSLSLANLGDREGALREGAAALEALPISKDAYDGVRIAFLVASARARLGDHDAALAQLAPLMAMPAGPHVEDLRRDSEWFGLRDDPRFRKLLTDHAPRA